MISCLGEFSEDEFLSVMYYDDFACERHEEWKAYYAIWAYPTCRFNGYLEDIGSAGGASGTYDRYRQLILDELARPSLLRMSLDLEIIGANGTVSGQIEALGSVPEALVHVVIYEDPGPRQPHVTRVLPVYAETLTARQTGQTQAVTGGFTVDPDWVAQDLHAIMYVQNAYASYGPLVVTGPGPGLDNPTDAHAYLHLTFDGHDYGFWNYVNIGAYGVDKYGLKVATGDIDGDGFDEILTGPGPGPVFGAQVRGFEYDTSQVPGVNFFAYGTPKYGVNVAAGDIDGDGYDEIITGAGPGAVFGPHVRAWDCDGTGTVVAISGVSYFAYGTPKWGVNVTAGDIDGDGFDEIITGAGPGAVYGPHVRGWNYDGATLEPMTTVSYLAYGTNKFGVNVACGDVDGDGIDEIITGAGPGAVFGPHVRGWNCDGSAVESISGISFFAFDDTEWGVNVAAGDMDGDSRAEIITGRGPNQTHGSEVRFYSFDGAGVTMVDEFEAYSNYPYDDITHGVNVAVGTFGVEVD